MKSKTRVWKPYDCVNCMINIVTWKWKLSHRGVIIIWSGNCREVEWYGCMVGRYRKLVYSVPKVEWYSVWWGRYRELVYSVPKERGGMV